MELSAGAGATVGTSSGTTSVTGNDILHEARVLEAFYAIPSIDKAWTCKARAGTSYTERNFTQACMIEFCI